MRSQDQWIDVDMRFALLLVPYFMILAEADPEAFDENCDTLRSLLPEKLRDFELNSCEIERGQTYIDMKLTVPAEQVLGTYQHLTEDLGMPELRFVCCGYETQLGRRADHPLPTEHPFDVYDNAVTFVLGARGIREEADGPGSYILELGDVDAFLLVTLWDQSKI